MRIIHLSLSSIVHYPTPFTLCLGFFDGVHRGHQALIKTAKTTALAVGVLTFSDNSARLLKNGGKKSFITPLTMKLQLFERYGVDVVFVIDFTDDLKALSPADFISKVLNRLGPANVVVGEDYHFGLKASGNAHDLQTSPLANFTALVVPPVYNQTGQVISSTLTKAYLAEGLMEQVTDNLGRNYALQGFVSPGLGHGKILGFPTANIALDGSYILPLNGVYLAYMRVDEVDYLGMANVGVHPSISPLPSPILEVHLFNFNQTIYGKAVTVYLLKWTRGEINYPNLDALIAKMKIDEGEIIALAKTLPLRP